LPQRFYVKLEPGSPRFASGNTAAQAWRRAYEKILELRAFRAVELTTRQQPEAAVDPDAEGKE
jgi:hypothetical protein